MPLKWDEFDGSKAALFRPGDDRRTYLPHLEVTPAALCAELSRLAYIGNRRTLGQILRNVGFGGTTHYGARKGTNAYLAIAPEFAVLTFRGTEDPQDWLADVKFLPQRWSPGGKVHRGFKQALGAVWRDVRTDLKALSFPCYYTGHSLGAALATLAASRLRPEALITFGSPRVGDGEFVRTLNNIDATRYVDCSDIVTELPPALLGFRHAGKLHYIGRNRRVSVEPADEKMTADRRRAKLGYQKSHAWKPGNVLLRELADHAPINYVSALLGRELG